MTKAVWVVPALLGWVVGSGVAGWPMTIVEGGRPAATIVTAAGAPEKVKAAADDLRRCLEVMTGASLPLKTDAQEVAGALILVGPSRLTEALGVAIPSGLTNARREEGYRIFCRGDRLVLAGNDAGPYHGTEYAVYDFLYRLGARWFMPGDFGELLPKMSDIVVEEMDVVEKPDFVMRNWWLHIVPELAGQERLWKIRNRMNPDSSQIFAIPGDSSVRNVLPPPDTLQTRPELFALNPDGSRNPYHPNLTNPETVAYVAERIKGYFRANPTANSFGFAPDDGLPRDYSPETLKLSLGLPDLLGRPGIEAEKSTTEEWFHFVNAVTAEVRREFPDVYIATNGYANRNIPPQGMKLDDHLVVMFAAIWCCTLHAYDDPHCWQKVRQGEMLQEWCKLCPNVWIYNYNYQMLVSGLTPLPEFTKLRRDFPLMKRWGVMGFFDESRNVWAEAGIPSRYLRARLEWDADADVDALLADFFARWYGPAAEPMRRFYEALDQAITTAQVHGHEDRVLPEIYTPSLVEQLGRELAAAEALAAQAGDAVRQRVLADRLIYDHLREYVAMSAAEVQGDFAAAADHAQRMLDLRARLHAISPFFIWPDENGYHTGVWYWKISDRRDWYRSLADKISGRTGDLVAFCPTEAAFRLDPHDDGRFQGWYKPEWNDADWSRISTARPFYVQGYQDGAGHPYVGVLWYRLEVEVPSAVQGRRVMLYIPNLTTEGWVWVNGQFVGYRPYMEAYVRPAHLECDVTEALRPGEKNLIAVRVNTSLSEAQGAEGLYSRAFLYAPRQPQQ